MDNNELYKYKKYKKKYLELKNNNNMTGGSLDDTQTIQQIGYIRLPDENIVASNGIKKVKLNSKLLKSGLYKEKHFTIIFTVISINEDSSLKLQGIQQAKVHTKEPRLIQLKNVPSDHIEVHEDGDSVDNVYPRNIPDVSQQTCIIIYFPEDDRQKFQNIVNEVYPVTVNSLEYNLQTILFDVLSVDGKYCEIQSGNYYFGRFPTKYLLFGEIHLKK